MMASAQSRRARNRPRYHIDVCAVANKVTNHILFGNYAAANALVDELIALADEKGSPVLESTWNRRAGLRFLP